MTETFLPDCHVEVQQQAGYKAGNLAPEHIFIIITKPVLSVSSNYKTVHLKT